MAAARQLPDQHELQAAEDTERAESLRQQFTALAARFHDFQAGVGFSDVQAMITLADEWEENRQNCVSVLCAYIRASPRQGVAGPGHAADQPAAGRGHPLRQAVLDAIAAHLRADAPVSWQGLDLDFSGVVFDGADFEHAVFSGGVVSFEHAVFSGGVVSFEHAVFSGGVVSFEHATFSDGTVDLDGAAFCGGTVRFERAAFCGGSIGFSGAVFSRGAVSFLGTVCSEGTVDFRSALFSGADVDFYGAQFTGGAVSFSDAGFSGGMVSFNGAVFSGADVSFERAGFIGSAVSFDYAKFTGTGASFLDAGFARGTVSFYGARFSGGKVRFGVTSPGLELGFWRAGSGAAPGFENAGITGGTVDFGRVADWSCPPDFDWDGTPPEGIRLPQADGQ
jgi:uncharacterized protein YjbI with pentapeptide repeats